MVFLLDIVHLECLLRQRIEEKEEMITLLKSKIKL